MEADISIWRKTGHFYFALTVSRSFVSRSFEECVALNIAGLD